MCADFQRGLPKSNPVVFLQHQLKPIYCHGIFKQSSPTQRTFFLLYANRLLFFLIFFPIANKTNYFPQKLFLYTRAKQTWFCTIALLWKLNCDQSNWIATFVIWGNGSKWLSCKQMLNWMSVLWKNKKLICQPFPVVVVPKFKAFEVNACNFLLLLIFEFRFCLWLFWTGLILKPQKWRGSFSQNVNDENLFLKNWSPNKMKMLA